MEVKKKVSMLLKKHTNMSKINIAFKGKLVTLEMQFGMLYQASQLTLI